VKQPTSDPLSGRIVLLPDGVSSTGGALTELVKAGARPLVVPLIEVRPVADHRLLDAALRSIRDGAYQWLAVSSAASVRALDERAQVLFGDDPATSWLLGLTRTGGMRVAAAGRPTVAALVALGIEPLSPERGAGPASLIGPLLSQGQGTSVLFARDDLAGPSLAGALRGGGLLVSEVVTHIAMRSQDPSPATVAAWGAGKVDAVMLTSPRAVHGMIDRLGPPRADVVVGCVDDATADAARSSGITVHTVGRAPTVQALVTALGNRFSDL
jgi:uroporphyrinogen-III synthase